MGRFGRRVKKRCWRKERKRGTDIISVKNIPFPTQGTFKLFKKETSDKELS